MHALGPRYTPRLALLLALAALALPAGASASTVREPPPTFTVPASARVHGTVPAAPATGAGAAKAGATTTPATAIPGSVKAAAPGTTGAAGATTPGATTPTTRTPGSLAPATTTPAPASTTPALPAGAPATRTPGAHPTAAKRLSTGAIVAAALAVLLIVVCLAWGVARWYAYEPRWSISLRHSLAEASWRLSASWDEFSDWARLGR
ncbi:MAG TPA: hypothetical protein VK756_08545 [Solirubrobacteraceae bacterium]|jgi:hypothetical protein|nr:hypothetical protein [Solirubrobacteraceae bacterium]